MVAAQQEIPIVELEPEEGSVCPDNALEIARQMMGEYVSTQMLVIHQWAGPSVVAQLAPDSTPDRAE